MPPVPKPKAAKTGRNRNLVIALGVAGIVALALIVGSIVLSRDGGGDATDDVDLPRAPRPHRSRSSPGSRRAGWCSATPTPRCGWCSSRTSSARSARRTTTKRLPAIVDEYVRPGKVKLDFRGLAFLGPDSVKALRISLAAGLQNKLWEVVGLFFENQGAENSGWVTDDLVDEILAEVPGLDADKVKADADSATVTDQIDGRSGRGDQRSRWAARPAFFVGVGDQPLYQIEPRGYDAERVPPGARRRPRAVTVHSHRDTEGLGGRRARALTRRSCSPSPSARGHRRRVLALERIARRADDAEHEGREGSVGMVT